MPPLVNDVLVFEKTGYDDPRRALQPRELLAALRYLNELRARRYVTVVLFHHFTLPFGALKHAAVALATGARVRAVARRRCRSAEHARQGHGLLY